MVNIEQTGGALELDNYAHGPVFHERETCGSGFGFRPSKDSGKRRFADHSDSEGEMTYVER